MRFGKLIDPDGKKTDLKPGDILLWYRHGECFTALRGAQTMFIVDDDGHRDDKICVYGLKNPIDGIALLLLGRPLVCTHEPDDRRALDRFTLIAKEWG